MATEIHPKHVAAVVAKTNRWVAALDRVGALETPAALIELEHSGPVGKVLADEGWDHLADLVCEFTGKARETAPKTTRRAIAQECLSLARNRQLSPKELAEAFAGLPH